MFHVMEFNVEIPQIVLIQTGKSSSVELLESLHTVAPMLVRFAFLQLFMHSSESAQAAWGCLHLEHRCEVGCSGEKNPKRPLISFGHRRRERHYYQISLFFSIGFRHWNLYLKSGRYSYKANLFKIAYPDVWVTSVSILPGQLSSLSPVFSFPSQSDAISTEE